MNDSCPICASVNWHTFLKKENRNVLICKTCGLGKLSPIPTEEELIEFYTTTYRKDHSNQELVSQEVIDYEQKRADHLLPLIIEYIKGAQKTIDIGSSSGTLVRNFTEINPNVKAHGLELNEDYLRFSIDNSFLNKKGAYTEPINKIYTSMDKDYDIVTLVHVLEHLYNPLETLSAIYDILKPGGILYVEVPNINTPYGNKLTDYFPIYHLFYFSKNTILKILEKTGFEISLVSHQGMGKYKISVGVVAKKSKTKNTMRASNDNYKIIILKLRVFFFLRRTKLFLLRFLHFKKDV